MLELRDLVVSYGPVEAVRGVGLEVGAAEIVALVGPNGAGKTSTLRAISGFVPYGGTIHFDGTDLRKLSVQAAARRGLIHVPEGRHVWPTLTVHENLLVGTTARRGRAEGYTIDEVYDLFQPLGGLRRRDGWALSGGEQQMVAIGRALGRRPAPPAPRRALARAGADRRQVPLRGVGRDRDAHADPAGRAEHRHGA